MKTSAKFSAPLLLDDRMFSKTNSSEQKHLFKSSKTADVSSSKQKKQITVFIVDDDVLYSKALELSISSQIDSLSVYTFQTGEACLQQMKKKPAIVILDYYLNSEIPYAWNGMAILRQIKKINPKTKVIILSSQDSLSVAIDCMENGAYDYISKTQTALVRINNLISNIAGDIEVNSGFTKIIMYFLVIVLIAIISYTLLNH